MLCRGQGEAQRRPRRGPAGKAWEMPCRGPGKAQEKPRRSPKRLRGSQKPIRCPKKGLRDASQKPRRSPEAQGKPRKKNKRGPGEAWEKLGAGPQEDPETFCSDPGKAIEGPRRGPGDPGADICLMPYQCLSSAFPMPYSVPYSVPYPVPYLTVYGVS